MNEQEEKSEVTVVVDAQFSATVDFNANQSVTVDTRLGSK